MRVFLLTDLLLPLCYGSHSNLKKFVGRWIMLGGLLFVVCVILQFHYHDPIPWYIRVLALIAQFVAFGEPAMRSAASKKN
jgi:hypothetical protein